jgi:hypothetical protein
VHRERKGGICRGRSRRELVEPAKQGQRVVEGCRRRRRRRRDRRHLLPLWGRKVLMESKGELALP